MKINDKKLQVALDTTDIAVAESVAIAVLDCCDIIEVGTPLIKSVGVRAISRIREVANDSVLIADMKTMDNGVMEVDLALDAGADGVTIQAAAPMATVEHAYGACMDRGKLCYIDSLGLALTDFLRIFKKFEAAKAVFHVGVDEQYQGRSTKDIKQFLNSDEIPFGSALAGGINIQSIGELVSLARIDTFIVGSAITKQHNAREQAEAIFQIIAQARSR